jgi:thiamine transport system permease protein
MKSYWLAPAFIVACIALGLVPLVVFAWQNGGVVLPDAYVWHVLRFTLLQATLSTLLSVLPAMFIARALARQRFFGRDILLIVLAVPLSLPVIVAIFGITVLYGASGFFAGWLNLYSLSGILLAHVFFNLPMVTRLLLENLQNAPPENHRLAAQLNFDDFAVFRHVDLPSIQPALPGVMALVFLLCSSSFVIVLLFGGPQATTLEVAIYQSLRMDFDVSRALTLTVLQIALSTLLVWAAAKALLKPTHGFSKQLLGERYDGKTTPSKIVDFVGIAFVTGLVVPILLSVLVQGLFQVQISNTLLRATLTSLGIASVSCVVVLPLAWLLANAQLRLSQHRGLLSTLSLASYITPPAVLATGWFLAVRPLNSGPLLAIFMIAMMNALMALPFLLSVLAPAIEHAARQHDRLCAQLDVRGWNRLTKIELPALRSPLAHAAMLAAVLSVGDLTAITLLGSQGLLSLPSLVQQQMGHYQSDAAGGTALVLACICVAATVIAQRFSRWS